MEENSKDNLDIFICTHKDFNPVVTNKTYKILCGEGQLKNKYNLDIFEDKKSENDLFDYEFSLAEGSRMYWLWKNYELKDYVGFCHYRKYFDFLDDIPDVEKIFETNDAIFIEPIKVPNVIYNYTRFHNFYDLADAGKVINHLYPDYTEYFLKVAKAKSFCPCNMFIMKKEDFKKYCEFIFSVIKEFCNVRGFKSDSDIENYVVENRDKYLKDIYPNNQVKYQARVLGYLIERLTNVFIAKNFKKIKIYKQITSEKKNGSY